MKNLFVLLLCCLILCGCTRKPAETSKPTDPPETPKATTNTAAPTTPATEITEPLAEATWPFDAEATPEAEPDEIFKFIVYCPNSNADGFYVNVMEWQIYGGSEYRPTLLDALIQACVLTKDVQINSVIQEGTHMTIDFNHAFKDLVCTMGTSGERMIVGSVVNTLIANYDVETVSITVDGEIWESGHVIYDFPMGFLE